MDQARMIQVTGRDGNLGWVDPREQTEDPSEVLIRLSSGQAILVPLDLLVRQEDGSYYLPMSSAQFKSGMEIGSESGASEETLMVIPIVVEKASVGKKVSTRRVRVSKRVHQHDEVIETPGFREEVHVERVPVNKEVKIAPEIRRDGETTIIPLLEEVLVVEKRLMVKEEVRITLKHIPNKPQTITLRSEELDVERLEGEKSTETIVDAEL